MLGGIIVQGIDKGFGAANKRERYTETIQSDFEG